MEVSAFTDSLRALSLPDIRRIAGVLEQSATTMADEIALTRAVVAVEDAVRRERCRQTAAVAGQGASRAVLTVAERQGIESGDPVVTRVARAAGQVARGLIVEASVPGAVELLFAPFTLVSASAAALSA